MMGRHLLLSKYLSLFLIVSTSLSFQVKAQSKNSTSASLSPNTTSWTNWIPLVSLVISFVALGVSLINTFSPADIRFLVAKVAFCYFVFDTKDGVNKKQLDLSYQ